VSIDAPRRIDEYGRGERGEGESGIQSATRCSYSTTVNDACVCVPLQFYR